MPYEGERAAYRPLERIVNSEQVRGLLSRAKQWQQENPDYPVEPKAAPESAGTLPDHIIAFDSSWHETPAGALQKDVYPSAQVGYITLSTVLLKTAELNRVSQIGPWTQLNTGAPATNQLPRQRCRVPTSSLAIIPAPELLSAVNCTKCWQPRWIAARTMEP